MEQLTLYDLLGIPIPEPEEKGFIRDMDCRKDTPVVYGKKDDPIYGEGIRIKPRVPGREDSEHMKAIKLDSLLPLEEYDLIIVLLSGGKDSVACLLKLLELGVPKEKIECWHHDIDGNHPKRRMDWRCTQNYVHSLCEAMGVKLRVSYRQDGFFGELYRIGASKPVYWIEPDTGEVMQCRLSQKYLACEKIKKEKGADCEEAKEFGYRMKFPAKSGDLSKRWCSAYLKIMVADTVMTNLDLLEELEKAGGKRLKSNLDKTRENAKILVVSGERRGESAGRSKYNEMEIHRTNAEKKAHRIVQQWRPVIDYSEKDVWEVMKRWHINPHPCYRAGWNRCSCSGCIFSTPSLFAGYRELYPEDFELLKQDEELLGFTLDNNKTLEEFVGNAKSCVCHDDPEAIRSLVTGEFAVDDVFVTEWKYPAGAFHGAAGGPC